MSEPIPVSGSEPAAPRRVPTRFPSRAWGGLAVVFYATHAAHHLLRGHPEDLLWACHLGALCVGAGLVVRSPALNAVGFLWLCMGNAVWGLDLARGGEFMPTSVLTHLGGLALACLGLARFGMPRHSWWKAVLAFLALQQLCRWTTPPSANVNLAHAVWSGWEALFPSYLSYEVLLLTAAAVGFLFVERVTRRLLGGSARRVLAPPTGSALH